MAVAAAWAPAAQAAQTSRVLVQDQVCMAATAESSAVAAVAVAEPPRQILAGAVAVG